MLGAHSARVVDIPPVPVHQPVSSPYLWTPQEYARSPPNALAMETLQLDLPEAEHSATSTPAAPSWLSALVTYSVEDLAALRARVNAFVLATLASQEFDPSSVEVEAPLYRLVLEGFDVTARRSEPTGAAFQGIVFGFLRADNPHLQIEIDKVRTGSKRLQRVGDVDGWEGARLAISAEVKQYALAAENAEDLTAFSNAIGARGALGVIAAIAFSEGARSAIEKLGLITLDRADMVRIVELWDPIKQRAAISSLIYYVLHVEKNSSLAGRLKEFIAEASERWREDRAGVASSRPIAVQTGM
ncbi:MAG TPA: hypothetical protein VKT77_00190 [Chthonomonadaceae bacterium]|nr:hypothetical protein [Chthonomonadaceae bacterium]